MGKPRFFWGAIDRGVLSVVALCAFASGVAALLAILAPSGLHAGVEDQESAMRGIVATYFQTGVQELDRGNYAQAAKTLRMAQGYREYLSVTDRARIDDLLAQAQRGESEKARVIAAKDAAMTLARQGQTAEARRQLAQIQSSPYLNEAERSEITQKLDSLGGPIAATPPAPTAAAAAGPTAADIERQAAVALYNRSYDLYRRGQFEPAKAGFQEFLTRYNEMIPPQVAEAVQRHIQSIDGHLAKPETRSVTVSPEEIKKRRVLELFNRSKSLYYEGHLDAARKGFVEVIASGMLTPEAKKRVEDYIETIDQLSPSLSDKELTTPPTAVQPVTPPAVEPAVVRPVVEPRAVEPVTPPAVVPPAQPTVVEPVMPLDAPYPLKAEDLIMPSPATVGPAAVAPVTPSPLRTTVAVAPPEAPSGSYIDEVTRRRNVVRGHTKAMVEDAVIKAHRFAGNNEFDKGEEALKTAKNTVSLNEMYLGPELFDSYQNILQHESEVLADRRQKHELAVREQQRAGAIAAQAAHREKMETERQQRIATLLDSAYSYWDQQKYEAAMGQLDTLLALDPQHDEALKFRKEVEDMIYFRKQRDIEDESQRERTKAIMEAEISGIPHADEYKYPSNWREIVNKPWRKPDEPIGQSEVDMAVYKQLDEVVDLSHLTPLMPLSQALDEMANSVQPPLRIV
ncbi:MAG TPA: hypothetical protein ENN81_08175, partial [Phycisphaerales bacterium]|nr:hypothetical protein [Phycisphaerales bacterium]